MIGFAILITNPQYNAGALNATVDTAALAGGQPALIVAKKNAAVLRRLPQPRALRASSTSVGWETTWRRIVAVAVWGGWYSAPTDRGTVLGFGARATLRPAAAGSPRASARSPTCAR